MIILIAIGGFLGACFRYLMTGWFSKFNHSFPTATLLLNLIGSCLIGISSGVGIEKGNAVHMFTVIGGLGAFTTFSTFAIEALQLMIGREYCKLLIYISSSLMGSSFCCMLCYYLMKNLGQ